MNHTMRNLTLIILFGFIVRLVAVIFFGDFKNDFYWEYGEIAKNIIDGKGYSLFYISGSELEFESTIDSSPSPSAYMPPGYTSFLIPFMGIKNIALRNILIYLIHIIISLLVIILIYYYSRNLFSFNTALIAAGITSLLPEFIYATLSFTPTLIFHVLVMMLFILISNRDLEKPKNLFYLGILSAAVIYFRSEFILFCLLMFSWFLFRKRIKQSLQFALIVILVLSPWTIRNIVTFEEFTPLSTNFGLNLYRGNNPYGIGVWGDEKITEEITALDNDNLETEINNIYKREAFSFIVNNPEKVILNSFTKLYYFWIFNPTDSRSQNLLYLIPSLIIIIFSIYGLYSSFNLDRYKFIYLFLFYFHLIIIVFVPLIRYQTMMKIALIPFCALGIEKSFLIIKNKLMTKQK